MLRMKHPVHGWCHAYNTNEEDYLRARGWGDDTPEPVADPDADPAESDDAGHTVESVRAQLDAAGIAYDKRLGVAKLLALLSQ